VGVLARAGRLGRGSATASTATTPSAPSPNPENNRPAGQLTNSSRNTSWGWPKSGTTASWSRRSASTTRDRTSCWTALIVLLHKAFSL